MCFTPVIKRVELDRLSVSLLMSMVPVQVWVPLFLTQCGQHKCFFYIRVIKYCNCIYNTIIKNYLNLSRNLILVPIERFSVVSRHANRLKIVN